MPYRVTAWQALDAEVRRIAREQLERALVVLADTSLDETVRVHAARKRCKKIRALLRLVRPPLKRKTYRRLNRHFRDAARRVSDTRDAAAFVTCYDRVCERFAGDIERRGTASIRAALTRRLNVRTEALADGARLGRLAADLERGRALIDTIEFDSDGFDTLRPGFAETYSHARAHLRIACATGTAEAHHEWRKRVKYHRCHLALLEELWPVPMGALRDEAVRLGELLGHAHDLAELDAHLRREPLGLGDPRHVEAFTGFANALRTELEESAGPLGQRLFAEKGKRVAKRLARWHASM